jgi:myosin heavy subunit
VDVLKALNDYLASTRKDMDALSAAARQYFEIQLNLSLGTHGMMEAWNAAHDAQVAFNAGLSESDKEMAKYRANVEESARTVRLMDEALQFSFNGFQVWEDSIARGAALTKELFYQQKIGVDELKDSITGMAENGALNMYALGAATRSANEDFTLLGDQDLEKLRAAIKDASDKLKSMQEEAQSAKDRIAELNAEIAAAKGDTATSDRMKLQLEQTQALADVETKLAEARQQNNRDLIALYETQKSQLNTLYDLKARNLEQEIKSRDTSTASADRTVSDLNRVSDAARSAQSAMGGLANTDLSGLHGQLSGLHQAANDLRAVL